MMFRLCLLLIALFSCASTVSAGCNPCASGYAMRASSGTYVPNGIGPPMTCGQLSNLACQRPAHTDAGQIIRSKAVQHCKCTNSAGVVQKLPRGISHTSNCPLKCMNSSSSKIPYGTLAGHRNGMTCFNMALFARRDTLTGSWCTDIQRMFNAQCPCSRRNLRGDGAGEEFEEELSEAEIEAIENSPEYQEMLEMMLAQEVDEATIMFPLDP